MHTLSHVRYTPHGSWTENGGLPGGADPQGVQRKSRFEAMRRDSARFMPALADCKQTGSLWEAKAILPVNDVDDGRPILFKENYGRRGLHCVIGGKIDNIFDALERLDEMKKAETW